MKKQLMFSIFTLYMFSSLYFTSLGKNPKVLLACTQQESSLSRFLGISDLLLSRNFNVSILLLS